MAKPKANNFEIGTEGLVERTVDLTGFKDMDLASLRKAAKEAAKNSK